MKVVSRPLFRIDPGWLFVIAGLAMLSAVIVLPGRRAVHEMREQLRVLKDQEALAFERLNAYEEFVRSLRQGDEQVIRRLAASHLNLVPEGQTAVMLAESLDQTVPEWIDETVDVAPSRPTAYEETLLVRLSEGRHRLWLLCGSVLVIFFGLLMGPDFESRPRRDSARRTGPDDADDASGVVPAAIAATTLASRDADGARDAIETLGFDGREAFEDPDASGPDAAGSEHLRAERQSDRLAGAFDKFDDAESEEFADELEEAESDELADELEDAESEELADELEDAESEELADELEDAETEELADELEEAETEELADELEEAESEELADELEDAETEELADELEGEETEELADELEDAETEAFADELEDAESDELADELEEAESEELADELEEAETEELADELEDAETEELDDELEGEETEELADELEDAETEEFADELVDAESDARDATPDDLNSIHATPASPVLASDDSRLDRPSTEEEGDALYFLDDPGEEAGDRSDDDALDPDSASRDDSGDDLVSLVDELGDAPDLDDLMLALEDEEPPAPRGRPSAPRR